MKEKLYTMMPLMVQNLLISLFNFFAYRRRYGGNYSLYLEKYRKNANLTYNQLIEIQNQRFIEFIGEVYLKSPFYRKLYDSKEIDVSSITVNNINHLDIIDKETIRKNQREIYTIPTKKGIVSKTGGTTGKSLQVVFTLDNMQERFALLDEFRSRFGYVLGKKTAWFSGKNLIGNKDVVKRRFWRTDYLYNVRYYSTFHIKEEFLGDYVKNLLKFKPEYMVGFPSTIHEIAKYGQRNNIKFPAGIIKAIFPTAETLPSETKLTIEEFFHTNVYDQYASSEGAPFIFECINHRLHVELQSGVFEVLDEKNVPSKNGRLVVTSFTTSGTPLIRYDIGDTIELSEKTCDCGNMNPVVEHIHGRVDDYIFSRDNGKINLGNVSNTLKDTKGIVRFQVNQDDLDSITIKLVVDKELYSTSIEQKFLTNWRDRLGDNMLINIEYLDDITVEKSGKFRLVKNNIKHLID